MVAYSHSGEFLKQEINAILLLSREPVPDEEAERENPPVTTSLRCPRSTAPRPLRRKPTMKSREDLPRKVLEGVFWLDKSGPESVEDECLLLGLT